MKKILFLSMALTIFVLFSIAPSQAITIGFNPITQDVMLGDQAFVDLYISGLGDGYFNNGNTNGYVNDGNFNGYYYTAPSLSAFDLDIRYDPAILSMNNVTFGDPVLGDQLDIWGLGGNPVGASNIAIPGVENIYEVSLDLPQDLVDYQADSFTLATLTFDTLALGTSALDMGINELGDEWGNPLTATVDRGSVNVIPEPATLLLLGSGLAGIGFFSRRRVRRISKK